MTTKEEIVLMKQRMDSMEEKMDKIDGKLDMLTEKLLDPDYGVTARVNRNTSYRKIMTKALWAIYIVTIGLVIKMFWE
jgi:tetrahydromethanopterin S-methyltransferase subunit B